MLFMFTLKVDAAKDPFNLLWDTKDSEDRIYEEYNIPYSRNLNYKDGNIYIAPRSYDNYNEYTPLYYYSHSEELLEQYDIDDKYYVLDAATDDEYLYLFVDVYDEPAPQSIAPYNMEDINYHILKIDENLDLVDDYTFNEELNYRFDYNYPNYGAKYFTAIDDKLSILAYDDYDYNPMIVQIDKNFKKYSTLRASTANMKKYFDELYNLDELMDLVYEEVDQRRNYVSTDTNGEYRIFGSVNYGCEESENILTSSLNFEKRTDTCSDSYLTLMDKDGNVVWDKTFDNRDDYFGLINTIIVDNYIVALGLYYENYYYGDSQSEIVVFDLEGNIVQTIYNDSVYYSLTKIPGGFSVFNNEVLNVACPKSLTRGSYNSCFQAISYIETYAVKYNIDVKVEGKGKVEVSSESYSNEEQTIKIIPSFGYKVKEIKVTDKEGNVIEVKDGKFTMPASDVTIEVIFDVENPNTADIAIIGTIVAGISFGIFGITRYRKLKFLK